MKTAPFEGKLALVERACIRIFLRGRSTSISEALSCVWTKHFFICGMKRGLQILPLFSLLKYRFHFTFISHLRMNLCRFIFTRVNIRVFTEKEKSQGIPYSLVSSMLLIIKESHKPQNGYRVQSTNTVDYRMDASGSWKCYTTTSCSWYIKVGRK